MRIVVSGSHASGKSTLISDFALRHPGFTVLPDPFELIDEAWDRPSAAMFATQLRVAADRLASDDVASDVIAERGPLDFLAYLLALDEWAGSSSSPELLERSMIITAEALGHVDLLVVLPLTAADPIEVDDDEHPELRSAMNDVLMDLIEDPDLVGTHLRVVELVGSRDERLSVLESLVSELGG
ncbi:AAA family ATPase [Compostimonas suwonensis]|uniref:AAA domain-containing protein n=1 Tax=Compostimonas suwonensis TaxID=1048394 RepID=A0A2M9BYP1_9MICO|nr:AAA family ATPase [Compostimonas suwonensis]PJJ63204.1 AAA domain-containing protein [Compostimonas suwonensis]